ncbi:hypothetical protein BBJ28_00013134 [Nothophytophthora sp. Chile5]|nr:hypothetical protein BBJ28_00013134 [Nothophytophthora sp. Chile5]
MEPLVDRFVFHTLLLSISNITSPEDMIALYHPDTGEMETKLVYEYEGFWLALLRRGEKKTGRVAIAGEEGSGSDDVEMEDVEASWRTLQAVIFDSVVKKVLDIIEQLDLSYKYDLQTTNNGKNAGGYLQIPQLLHLVFVSATKMPLVSSFYRIGTVLAMTIDELQYFDASMDLEGVCHDDARACLRGEFAYFVTKVCAQIRFYRDELLVACAAFVLATPVGLFPIDAASGVLKSALELGRSFLPAASIAITALERWQRQCPEELGRIIGEIAPLLAPYLDQSDANDAGSSSVNTEAVDSSDFSRLQHRVMVFLGNSGGKVSLLMSEPPSIVNPDGVIGDNSLQYFQLSLDLNGVAVPLALHTIFAYLGELAIQSTDRRVKTSASESYHALICYLCGKTATRPHAGGKKSVFYELWRKAFSNIVLLATDPEKICRALFEPLLFQLLRWFASNNDGFPFEYANLLDQLVRGLSDPENSAVRALSGRGIATLLTLSLDGQASGSGVRTKADVIFRRLFSLCRHPGAAQRSGAAIAVSCFLRSLNEDDGPALTTFALDCVKNLLYALRLCDRDVRNGIGGADVSQDLISRAVLKIERGISRFPQLFLKATASGEDSILQQMTMWLFQQTAKRECLFRRLCRRLFVSFSALVTGSSCKQWLIGYAAQYGGASIGATLVPMSALARALPSSGETGDMIDWMEQLSASIESCTWCVGILGDKSEEILGFDAPDGQRVDLKRKHSELPTESTSEVVQTYQRTVSWAITNFLKSEAPWKNPNPALMASPTRTQLIGAYLSVLVSLCNCITSSMNTENTLLVQVADFRSPSFQAAVVEKLLQCFVYQPHAWADDEHAFDEIRAFCAGVVAHNKDWAREMQRCAEALLLPLSTCLAEVNNEDDYVKRAREIRALCVFGNEVLSTNILQQDVASRHDIVFALAANKSIKFGRSLPDHLRIAVLALKAAAACGWDITTIFVSDAGRRAYGAVHNDVVHFIPTLVAWRQCAKSLVALALTNLQVLNVLVDALDQVASFKLYKAGSAELDSFVETLLPSIKNFVQNLGAHTSDTQQTLLLLEALRLLLQLCQHCSKRLVEPLSMGPLPDIRDAVLELLKQRECSYLVKADILRILALLGPSSSLVAEEDEGSMKIVEALVSFVVDEFPIVSTDVTRGSKDFDVFRVLFVGLLAVIEQSKSVVYLRIIFPSLKERQSHLFFEEIKLSLGRFSNELAVTKSGGANKNDKVLLELVKLTDILLDSSQDTAIRKTLLKAVFTPLIELQPVDTLQRFYLMESLAAKAVLVGMLATKISTSADITSAASRFGVSVAFALVEILYRLADPEFIRNDINAAFLGHKNGKGREFTMLVCKCASKVVTTYGGGDEVTRLACCQAYSCLLTAVSRTQKQEKFFDQILFQDSIWNNIIDNSREYELHAETKEFDKVPLSSFSTTSLQSQREANTRRGASSALKFFTASSLSLDPDTLSVSMTVPVDIDQGGATYHNLEIELDALNEHPCMVPLLRVLMQMKTDFGSNWDETAMPGWMKKLFGVMENTSTELNVRLFLTKVVLNVPNVFTPYASSWLEKVMDALLEATVSTSAGSGCEFHYLLRDCCNLVLDVWKDVSMASMRGTVSRFLNTLVELCPHRINFIRDDNVLLTSQLILLWKDSVSIDVQLLARQLFSDDDNARVQAAKQYTSLQLISAMVTAGQASDLHSELGFVEGQTIEDGILLAMKNKKASLFVVAAEVGGLYSTKAKQDGTFKHELVALITSAYNEEDFGRFLALLRNASLHQPDIIDATMLHRLSFVLPKVIAVDAWSLLAMETLGNATANEKVTAEIFTHVQSVLDRFIAHRHVGVQYSTLQAVTRIVDHLTEADLERLIKNVSQGGLGLLEYYEVHEDAACPFQTQVVPGSTASQYAETSGALQAHAHGKRGRRFVKQATAAESTNSQHVASQYGGKAAKKFFQDQHAMEKKRQEARSNRERNEQQGRVDMRRKYRMGEFPDIQITQRDIVEPIMALCETHPQTSSIVFAALFSSIVASKAFEQSSDSSALAKSIERSLLLSKTSSVYVGCVELAFLASLVNNEKLFGKLVVPPNTIGVAGLASGNNHASQLLLEEFLICSAQRDSGQTTLTSRDWTATCWDQLHKILGAINKSNFLIALSSTCSTTDESKLALQAQLSGDLPVAVASYKKADNVLASQIEDDYSVAAQSDASRCYWQRMDCLETLNNWDTLLHEIDDATTQDNDFLWSQESPYLEQGVGHYLRSCLGLVAKSRDGESSALGRLQQFVDSVTADSAKQELVNSRFPVEKCLAYLAMGDSNQARVCVENFYHEFLAKWRHASGIATSTRSELMQSLSSMVEIDEMLGLVRDGEHHVVKVSGQRDTEHLAFAHKWVKAAPFTGEGGLTAWSQFAMVQNYVGGFLLEHGLNQGTLSDDARLPLLREKGSVMLKYATAALSGDILALASKNLKDYRELCNAHKLPKVSVEMVEVFVSHVLKLADRQLKHKRSDLNSGSIKLITRYYETATKMFDNVEMMEVMETVGTDDRVAMGYLEAKTFASAAEFYAVSNAKDGLKEEYFSRALDVFQQSCKLVGVTSGVADNKLGGGERKAFSRCRLTFIEFLADLLFKDGRGKWDQLVDRKLVTQLLVDNVLGGMARGDRECSNYFPQLCEVIAPYPDLLECFKRQVLDNVPLWTCLQWSAQLMALLNGPIGDTIVAILEKVIIRDNEEEGSYCSRLKGILAHLLMFHCRSGVHVQMATQYPVALFYDFKVTCGSSLSSYKVELHRLEALLANPVMEKFVEALRLIHHPELRLKEGLREIARLLTDNRTDDARQKIELLWKDCFSPDRPRLGGQIGRYNRDWSHKAKRDVEKLLGKNGSNMTVKTVTAAREWIMNHFSVTPGRYGITKDMKAQLGDFAEWLEEFDHSSCSLELPGQYTTYWGKPDPSTHIRILGFDSMLGVLASKQLPKRLTLHCSDEKDYTFLVKGGEDLRLDQRIEQLFDVMNQILAVDPRCRDRNLSTRTYKVIPMTQEIGIIEWLHCTSTLKGVIETQLQKDDRCANLQSNKRQKLELFNTSAAKAYESFLLKQRGASFSAKVIAPQSSEVTDQFSKVQALIPGDLLRRQLLGLGSDFQAFLLVRDHFLKSLAVFSACSYILGIGDRHLDNFLLDHTNGRVIGIDFGVSFGAGASVLPVPELVPFRYTRQMDFVFQPYDGANLLAQDMQAVFEALRAKRQVIESVMDVFLHEPLMDWQQSTTIHQKGLIQESEGTEIPTLQDSDVEMKEEEEPRRTRVPRSDKKASASIPSEAGATAWLPDVKIAIARRKLEGVSPKLLLKEELAQNLHLSRQLGKFHSLIDSACGSDDVATGNEEMAAMSSLAQAQELLALATSPDLLGRTYHGWMPWL